MTDIDVVSSIDLLAEVTPRSSYARVHLRQELPPVGQSVFAGRWMRIHTASANEASGGGRHGV